jgi:membrane protein implicated in regulation of membrane protease activity
MIGALDNLWLTHPFWLWMALAALLLALEIATGSGYLLWPSGSAAVVAVLSLALPHNAPIHWLIFAILTVAATLAGRRFLPRNLATGPDINDNAGRLVGHQGDSTAAFNKGEGRVFIDGKEWAAVLQGDGAVAAGAKVEVVAVEGSKLTVRAVA